MWHEGSAGDASDEPVSKLSPIRIGEWNPLRFRDAPSRLAVLRPGTAPPCGSRRENRAPIGLRFADPAVPVAGGVSPVGKQARLSGGDSPGATSKTEARWAFKGRWP
jgi:hypothetical protein